MESNISQELLDETRSFSDLEILNILNQNHILSGDTLEAARIVAAERNLLSSDEENLPDNRPVLVKEAQTMIEDEVPIDEILRRFSARGIDNETASSAIHSASLTADINKKVETPVNEDGGFQWWYLILLFFIVRMILRFANN